MDRGIKIVEPDYDAILKSKTDDYGETKAAFQFAAEEYARQYFKLNNNVSDAVNSCLPSLDEVKKELKNYKEPINEYGAQPHVNNGVNWALNYVTKKAKTKQIKN